MADTEDVADKEAAKSSSPKPDTDQDVKIQEPVQTGSKRRRVGGGAGGGPGHRRIQQNLQSNATPAGGKKNIVLSGDAMKEMARQAKAMREGRRSCLDARHKFLFAKIAQGMGVEDIAVEEQILGDEKFDLMDDFFAAKKLKKLMFYFQEPVVRSDSRVDTASVHPNATKEKLFISTGEAEPLVGSCYFFVKTNDKAITTANIANEVNFGMIEANDGGLLKGVEELLGKVMVPALRAQDNWGRLSDEGSSSQQQIADFIESIEKFVGTLSTARSNMEGRFELDNVEIGYNLDHFRGPADYAQAAASNLDLLEKLEMVLGVWCKQIDQVLVQSEQMRKEADDIGPAAELDHWKQRMAKFSSLLDEIKTPKVRTVVGILHAAKSRSLRAWHLLDSRITDATNEAKDNVKYLYTLDKFFGPLSKCTPQGMIEVLPGLLNSIRMIHSVSQFYNTSERMTSLFVKVTNQMITTCKHYVMEGKERIWELARDVVLERIANCVRLNEEYQKAFHRTKAKLKDNPNERQFEFSENYIFGKFDTFCGRLNKLADMISTMTQLAKLKDVKMEGIDSLYNKYQAIVQSVEKKKYDVLDHRKAEFEVDYAEFRGQVDGLQLAMQHYMDSWFDRPLSTEYLLKLLGKFERIAGANLDIDEKYNFLLIKYNKDLDSARKTYQKMKSDPPIARNLPPVSGKIAWAKQMYRKVVTPMEYFQAKDALLKSAEGKKAVRAFNKMAAVLLEYEVLYHRGWIRQVDTVKAGLQSSVLVRHPETGALTVNFDPAITELIAEAKYLTKIGLEIPDVAFRLCLKETLFNDYRSDLTDMIKDFENARDDVAPLLGPLLKPFIVRVEDKIAVGLTTINWNSLNIETYIKSVYAQLEEYNILKKRIQDIMECRIGKDLEEISTTALCSFPEDEAISCEKFLQLTDDIVKAASSSLVKRSADIETSVFDMIEMLSGQYTAEELEGLENQAKSENLPVWYYALMGNICQRNTDAMVKSTRLSLDLIKRRLQQVNNKYSQQNGGDAESKTPLFKSKIVLSLPAIVLKPSLDDIQNILNKSIDLITSAASGVSLWKYADLHFEQQQMEAEAARKMGEDIKQQIKRQNPIHKQISDHKDVTKIVFALNSVVSSLKTDCDALLKKFSDFSEIWVEDPQQKIQDFKNEDPAYSEYEAQIRHYNSLEGHVEDLPTSYQIGSVLFETDDLKLALVQECKAWKRAFGSALNDKAGREQDQIFEFVDNLNKRMSRGIKDLDDVRDAMSSLSEMRENQIKVDMTIGPIEESYALLNKLELVFNDGNAEKVDGLAYAWKTLQDTVVVTQSTLLEVQPGFKTDLLSGVEKFHEDTTDFYRDYAIKGPNMQGIPPREASDRLQIFQTRFDELWRKFQTYSGGEVLFGLTVTEYPDLQRIKRELALLQKLYGLYNTVIDSVNGYNDILWSELDIEAINNELLDFQNKCRKLPKALKEWDAFNDLKQKIDDFNDVCPLLEMMADKAMMQRHWERIAKCTGHTFDVENENFQLKNITEAPILENKEDIEDICISAVKEKDIEAKLKQVMAEWSNQIFTFSTFKARGELLLKGADIQEIIALMEDSLMVLASLMSNRYNAPFKPQIQSWVQKLSGTTEIIENWLIVQNLWVYLEAVFVGGDIAKQLPQEAKRFTNIDKSWQKIMQKAHETTNVVQCCTGDDTMAQLLPHLLEQLEMCQKSLTGYLEKKRLLFPRFFFVSDPALLEILGQASDSHTIQAHCLSLFDNVFRVDFDEKVYDKIVTLRSQEDEAVDLAKPVMAQGNVEVWLKSLLDGVLGTVHSVIKKAWESISDTANFKLIDFVSVFPAQIGLLGIQMLWSRDAEIALSAAKSDKKIMATYNQKFLDILNEFIGMTTLELTKYERTKFETLVTIHVHQRDIFDDLCRLHIKSPGDFEWLKQSRFYFIEDINRCLIQITDVDFDYCNEYTGCTERLVITPLTDRCYITLAQALGMSLGGAPAGPAGTGKTETTKDMGKCLGKYVVVFNCSDQMDFRGLGRIYKGLAQSGSWGCFDEFNRIELPVLSVAAQQIAIVLMCKKMNKPQFIFTDGDVVDMNREFGIFLTMNPGYAGRQELPENLKIIFRPVAMMVPDRSIIIRVKLASCGFVDNIILSKKFFTLYKLCEEQLSKQVHYDFGLRNILSVLRTLGAVKRANPEDAEQVSVMRVLRDMNLSKLVDEDEPLFLSLINDLFPGIQLEKAGYPDLEAIIEKKVTEAGLMNHAPWILKLIQLFETQRVRHGMMVLGPSGAGKTKCIHTLMKAMTEQGEPHREMRMNPKAITAQQMFGTLDVATNDWTDGIFSTMWRRTHKAKKGEHIWLVLDGPVDAIWIENLNSVLDDNKTLTLANGDRIPMYFNSKIVFEPHNVDNASPATVSRNGMVFMSSSVLDWQPIIKAWLNTIKPGQSAILWDLFESCYQAIYNFLSTQTVPKMSLLECMYIRQTIDLLQGLLPKDDSANLSADHLGRIFFFAVMWSLGALLELEDRAKLEEFIKGLPDTKLPIPPTKDDETIFEYLVGDDGEWLHWNERTEEYLYPTDSVPDYMGILVPNVDNTRTVFLMHTIMKQEKGVLLIGEQGTAKTVMIKGYCAKYDPEAHLTKSLNFSSATTPNMFQRTIESYVDKRVGTTYGPPAGRKMSVFIDDINMPIVNNWGDQITNEIVRQLMGNKGFYSLDKPGDFTNIVDIQFVAAMIHPGGGRNDIPQRLKRQLCIFNCTLPSNNSIDKIFSTVGEGYFCKERGFGPEVMALIPSLVPLTRRLWQATKVKMLPTPAKFHYIFNLRDLSRIWQGILNVDSEVCCTETIILSLWKHECQRVISDRFTNHEDKIWFNNTLTKMIAEDLPDHAHLVPEEPYFVDFLRDAPEATGEEGEDVDLEAPKIYEPIESYESLEEKLRMYEETYNEITRGSNMDLVFFKDAMTHLIKISRVIRTPRGNSLLVGVGGSGKQSLTRLATYIAGYSAFQITLSRTYNVSNLTDDLKILYKTAGKDGKGVTFIFTDNEIKDEAFLEYMNNVLASGEVSNLFARDEIDEINAELIPVMKKEFPRVPPTNENLYAYFLQRVKSNLHVVLCFSPVGEKFQNRAMKFPALISGCTMDWFLRWPRDALIQVASYFVADFKIECTPEVKGNIVQVMGSVQDLVAEKCVEYFERYRRACHVTPKSYLSFLTGYKDIYKTKLDEISVLSYRMKTGLEKLIEASKSVDQLSKELAVKEKDLAVASKEAEVVLKIVAEKAEAAGKIKASVQVVKDKAQNIVDVIEVDKAAAMVKLEAARPALESAEKALQTIKPADIATVRKLGKPPHLIMRIMDCVILLFQKRINTVEADPDRPCVKPSWSEALKLMNNSGFLSMLLNFQKDSINEETVELLAPYLTMDDYSFESAKKVCGNVAGLCSWTEAMSFFFGINKEVLPLKANLAVQEVKLGAAMADLNTAQATLDEKEAELQEVQAQYDAAINHKQALIDDAEACKRKMVNASALIDGLSGEKVRWTAAGKLFNEQITRLVGDVLLATGFLSYSGPFNQDFRTLLQKAWKKEMADFKIPFSEDINLITMLVDNATVGEWNLQGLPKDDLSVQNGIIVTRASRFPLLIDPQGQGKVWIRSKEKNNELQVTTLNHKYFRTHLEDSLSLGRPLMIEDVAEELDPVLDNVLEKNFIKSGSTFKVKVGDKEVDVMKGFQLYITTKLANPAYTPEIYARTSIIDFTVTMSGLEDQLLARVILAEKAELEAEMVALMEEVTANKRKMKELEDNLLYRLTTTEGSLVEDESLIKVLQVTKTTAEEVSEKLTVAAETEIKINTAREEFRPVATRGSILYFLIVEMSLVNVMYQTSLRQVLELFDLSLQKSAKSMIPAKRIDNIIKYLTFDVFRYTTRGLYEEHKFLYVLLLTLKLALNMNIINHTEFQTFIKGGASLDLNAVQPKPKKWILDMTWLNLVQLSKLPQYSQILSQISRNDKAWRAWLNENAPEEATIPDGYSSSLDQFRKLLLIRSWCPDRVTSQALDFIGATLGKQFTEAVILNYESMLQESNPTCPMICFLTMGSDPTESIERLARAKGLPARPLSMGQGQEVHARRILTQSFQDGGWIIFQNCHLGLPYMDELLEQLQTTENIKDTYRTWITAEVHPKFPINLLQSSIKYTNEPPQGIKAGLKRTYSTITQEILEISNMPQWKPMLFSVAFLYTTVQERRKFGPLGWNIPYEYNQCDYQCSVQFVQNHLDELSGKKGISWNTVRYMLAEINFGGRVTDALDKELLNTYTRVWFGDHMFSDKFCFFKGYSIPQGKTVQEYRDYIEALPLVDTPEVMGLHPNADITYQTNFANAALGTIVSIQPKESSGGGGETREQIVFKQADEMLEKLPDNFLPHEVKARLQKMGPIQPMNIFLRQELDRMQRVITIVRTTLTDLKLAIDGTIIMSENLRDALDQMYDARVPNAWHKISWDSSTLGFWFTELLERHTQFHTWIFEGRPNQFWLTGFFNPQGFLTAMRQEVTRAHTAKGWALDSVVLYNDVTKMMTEDVTSPPPAEIGGVYVYGLFLDGAGWDRRNVKLLESPPKILYTALPVVHVYAINTKDQRDDKKSAINLYMCPVYKKPRRTDLTFIFKLILRTTQQPDHWALRGVAILCDTK